MTDIKSIKNLVETSNVARDFFESLSARVKNYRITTVDQAMRSTKGGRREVVDLFKQMEALGLGYFIVGRRSGVSRFEWSVRMVETARAALGDLDLEAIEPLESEELDELETEEIEDDEDMDDHQFVRHSFVLRPRSAPFIFVLPEDLTEHEAQRLSRFMLSLPFEPLAQ